MDLIDIFFFLIGKGFRKIIILLGFRFPDFSDGGLVVLGFAVTVFLVATAFVIGSY
jgi:hypothetical protein